MNLSNILISTAVVAAVGLVIAILLSIAEKKWLHPKLHNLLL